LGQETRGPIGIDAMKKGKKRAKMGPWPRLQKFWDIRAAGNFIGGGTGSGLLMIAAIFILIGKISIAAIIVGAISVSLGLLMVFLEIGRPWRSINMFFHPQTSWMTREGIVVMPLFLTAGLAVFYAGQPINITIAIFMGFFALVFLYCQVRILHAAKGIPAWRHPCLRPYIFSTGITEALGVAVCIPGLMTEQGLWIALTIALTIRFLFWKNYLKNLERDGAPEASCAVFEEINPKVQLAHIIAIVLLVAAWLTQMPILAVPAGLIATATGWTIKAIIVTKAAQTRGFAIPRTPVRGQGKSRVLGRQR